MSTISNSVSDVLANDDRLIALMLGRLRMTVKQAIAAYNSLAREVFGKRRRWKYIQFDHRKLQNVITSVVRDHCNDENSRRDGNDILFDQESTESADSTRNVCRW